MKTKRTQQNSKTYKDSGYLLPIICIVSVTLISAVLITLCISVVLSSEEIPPMTSLSQQVTPPATPTTAPTADGTLPETTRAEETRTDILIKTDSPVLTSAESPRTQQVTTARTTPIVTEPPVTTQKPVTENPYGFKAELSAYEPYIDPSGEKWDNAFLTLVNTTHTLEKDQEKNDPVLRNMLRFADSDDYDYTWKPSIYLNEYAMKALSAMFIEAKANGVYDLDVTSAYRDYAYQKSVFGANCEKTEHWICENSGCTADWIAKESVCPICGQKTSSTIPITQEEREANVATYSCAPGTSDHQTGLAVDIVQTSLPWQYQSLIQEFGETEAGKWLAENCWKFGFVLRFPADKEEITGIIYEPWHFRYVGRTHAEQMHELNMCLEEYIEYLDSVGYFE